MLHLQTSHCYTLNESGAQIWQGIQAQQSLAEISQRLAAYYALSQEEAATAVAILVYELRAEKLVGE